MSHAAALIAADDPTQADALRTFLASLDLNVGVAIGANEVREALAALQPDLVVLDMADSADAALDLSREIKRSPATRPTAVLICTPLNDVADIERAVGAGCDDFVAKPVQEQELLSRVRGLLRRGP